MTYCFRVAGVVGLMMCHVVGIRREAALVSAANLGLAMQLTNICRDVEEDLKRGRIYLPAVQWQDDVLDPKSAVELRAARVVRRLLKSADALYRSGGQGLSALGLRVSLSVHTALRIYRAIGDALKRQGFDPFAGRAVVGKVRKLGHVALVLSQALSRGTMMLFLPSPKVPSTVIGSYEALKSRSLVLQEILEEGRSK